MGLREEENRDREREALAEVHALVRVLESVWDKYPRYIRPEREIQVKFYHGYREVRGDQEAEDAYIGTFTKQLLGQLDQGETK